MGQEHIKRDRDYRCDPDDEVGIEPAFRLTPVKQELDAGQCQPEANKAEPVELALPIPRCFANKGQGADHTQSGKGHGNIKHPAPAIFIGEPAAEDRTHHRREHDPHTPDGEGGRVAFARV